MKNHWERELPVLKFVDHHLSDMISNIDEIFGDCDFDDNERRAMVFLKEKDAIHHSAFGYYWGKVEIVEYNYNKTVIINYIEGTSNFKRLRSCFVSYKT